MKLRLILAATLSLQTVPVWAQDSVSPLAPPVTTNDLSALASTIPQPADSAPAVEVPGGAPGATMTFRRGDAIDNRISRTGVFTVSGALGMIGGTWAAALPSGAASYPMFFTGIGAANTAGIKCKVVSSTNTAFSAQCTQDLLSILAIGSGVAIPAVAGTQVYALALPSTQASQ